MGAVSTPNLDLLRVQETWQFADEAFNRFIDDADNKLVGVAHLESPKHWTDWKPETEYAKDDIVRITKTKTHQYYQCIYAGTSGTDEPINNVTGSILTDGTVQWKVMSLSEADITGGAIQIWLSGWYYNKGDAVLYGTALYRCKVDHTASNWLNDYIYWQEVCASIRMWQPVIYYFEDDTVVANGLIYKCITAHRSSATFSAIEEANWELIGGAGGAGDWASGKIYQEGQLITVNDILYKANQKHTSGSDFQSDLAKWDKVDANIKDWEPSIYYPVGTLVNYQGIMYKCGTTHTATTSFYDDRANWVLFHNPIIDWKNDTYYYEGQLVIYNGCLYRCNTSHGTSTIWVTVYPQKWRSGRQYNIGDSVVVVEYVVDVITGVTTIIPKLYRCETAHTSSVDFEDDKANWHFIKDLSEGQTTWQPNTTYMMNDSVMYGGITWDCISVHLSSQDFLDDLANWGSEVQLIQSFSINNGKWDLLYANIQEWKSGVYYKEGSVVLYNNMLFKCITGHDSSDFANETAKWQQLNRLDAMVSDWQPDTQYWQSQLVLNDDILYRCKVDHTSSSSKFIADYDKWDVVNASISSWEIGKEYIVGDMIVYNTLLYRCIMQHTATDFALDINDWELLCGINEWTANTTYKVGAVIERDGMLYKATSSFTSGNTFDSLHLRPIGGGGVGGAVVWQANTAYSADQLIIYDKLLYRATADFTSGQTFSRTYLDQITIGWTAYWQPYTYYTVGETVVQANSILRCAVAHTSLGIYNTSEATNWVMIASAQAIITYWTPNTQYTNGNAVIHNDILYICNITHTSSADFADDMIVGYEKWRTINTSATSGSWEQLTKMGVVAPRILEIIINNTSTFCTSPVEVLKFRLGTQDETINEFTFIAGDGQKFTVDDIRADTNEYVIFDGQVKLKTEYVYPMTLDVHTDSGYIYVSDEIDLSGFKGGEDMVVK